jgi:hypothetical protein
LISGSRTKGHGTALGKSEISLLAKPLVPKLGYYVLTRVRSTTTRGQSCKPHTSTETSAVTMYAQLEINKLALIS